MPAPRVRLTLWLVISAASLACHADAAEPRAELRKSDFTVDPKWEAVNNRIILAKVPTVVQDFGYSPTNFAGRAGGELGGFITRASRTAFYGARIKKKTLDDRLSASGTFYFEKTGGGGGLFFGWFLADQPGASGRPLSSLGLHLDTEVKGGRLAIRLLTHTNQSAGTFLTKYEQYRSLDKKEEARPTPIKTGVKYRFHMEYDPAGSGGHGRVTCTVRGNSAEPGGWEGQTFAFDVPADNRADGATFDRFGMMNMTKAGGSSIIYFDDLEVDGQATDFTSDPNWDGRGNHDRYEDRVQVGAHDFGFSPKTNFAGGSRGEIGGDFWRSGDYATYADRVGPLTLDRALQANGRVCFLVGGPDADMYIGWFDSKSKTDAVPTAANFVGVHVGGPTRVGHYFHPAIGTGGAIFGAAEGGPVLKPGQQYEWSVRYDPAAADGRGSLHLTLDDEQVTLPLKAGVKKPGITLDRFGMFTSQAGGQLVRIYLDDLEYTAK